MSGVWHCDHFTKLCCLNRAAWALQRTGHSGELFPSITLNGGNWVIKHWNRGCFQFCKERGELYAVTKGADTFTEELKALYMKYWPKVQVPCMQRRRLHCCVSALTLTMCCHMAYRWKRDLAGKDIPVELKERFVVVITIPIAIAECVCVDFEQLKLWA